MGVDGVEACRPSQFEAVANQSDRLPMTLVSSLA
jgi:hypothetical protein